MTWDPVNEAVTRSLNNAAGYAALVLLGCSAGDLREADSTSMDARWAGAEVVVNAQPAWTEQTQWAISEQPSLTIGSSDGGAVEILSRVGNAVRMADGRIAIADGGSSQLRFHDSTGRFLRAAGGAGDGPGEFRFLSRIALRHGDSIAALDNMPRVALFEPDGNYMRSVQVALPVGAGRINLVDHAKDGTLLGMSGSRSFGWEDAGKVVRDTTRLYRIDSDGAPGSLIASYPGQERWGLEAGGRLSFPFIPFSAGPVWAAGADRFASASGRDRVIDVWETDGSPAFRLEWPFQATPVTPEMLDSYAKHRLSTIVDPNEVRRVQRFLADAPAAEHLPFYQRILFDDPGTLWVEEYRPPWDEQGYWQVFTGDGEWLGRVSVPERVRLFHIGADFVLGRWLGEYDVEYVQIFRLEKGEVAHGDA